MIQNDLSDIYDDLALALGGLRGCGVAGCGRVAEYYTGMFRRDLSDEILEDIGVFPSIDGATEDEETADSEDETADSEGIVRLTRPSFFYFFGAYAPLILEG